MNAAKMTLLAIGILAAAATAQAAPHRVGDFVFPKSYPGTLQRGQHSAGQVSVTEFLTVLEVKGEWLWVERHSIYNTSEAGPKGYVRASEVDSIDEQIAWAETIIAKDPSNPDFHEYAGLIARLSDRPDLLESAISFFTRAIELSPANQMLYQQRAYCWSELHQYEPAIADVEAALRLDPANQGYRDALAYFRGQLGAGQDATAPPAPVESTSDVDRNKPVPIAGVRPAA